MNPLADITRCRRDLTTVRRARPCPASHICGFQSSFQNHSPLPILEQSKRRQPNRPQNELRAFFAYVSAAVGIVMDPTRNDSKYKGALEILGVPSRTRGLDRE